MVERVSVYRAPSTVADADEIAAYLQTRADVPSTSAPRFLEEYADTDTPERFARTRVLSPFDRDTGSTMHGIVQYEARTIEDPARGGGVLYDGTAVQRIANDLLPDGVTSLSHLHVVLLDRHLGTWGEHDGRWHKRIAVLGQPTLISVPGLAEAPAKPEAYYELKQKHALVSGDAPPREVLESAIDEDVLVPGDPRTTDALCGYALAGVHLLETGEAFCESQACRLFNGHRHGEVIRAQLDSPEFCERHARRYGSA